MGADHPRTGGLRLHRVLRWTALGARRITSPSNRSIRERNRRGQDLEEVGARASDNAEEDHRVAPPYYVVDQEQWLVRRNHSEHVHTVTRRGPGPGQHRPRRWPDLAARLGRG